MSGLSYEELAAVYELRNGYDSPTQWKRIAQAYGVTWQSLYAAIKRLESGGLNRDADGEKPLGRVTEISTESLEQIEKAIQAGNSWPKIADALGVKTGTVKSRYRRWKQSLNS